VRPDAELSASYLDIAIDCTIQNDRAAGREEGPTHSSVDLNASANEIDISSKVCRGVQRDAAAGNRGVPVGDARHVDLTARGANRPVNPSTDRLIPPCSEVITANGPMGFHVAAG
jgi:hypothetical protein